MDLYDEIIVLQSNYSKEHKHILEVCMCSDMDMWTCDLGAEAWSAALGVGHGNTPREAFNNAVKNMNEVISRNLNSKV